MFTDMVGYTSLGQKNESLSLVLVEEQRKIIRGLLVRHNGKEVKTMGDAFLVEFPNALDAVRCAYDIQRVSREFNISQTNDRKFKLRIGLHLGDVEESNGDIFGDAVNVASRIEPLADEGGICLTRQVYDHVRNKFELPITSAGSKSLKNVETQIEVFKIVLPWDGGSAEPETQSSKRIVVLPFVSLSPDPNDEYFADGLTEELITKVSLVNGLEVIARTSAMNYKNKEKNASQIGRELKVGTLLEGSVRKSGNRVRVSAQLINANTEGHIWAESYDKDLNDIFEVQSSVAENVAGALKLKLLSKEKERIERSLNNTEAYVEYLRGLYFAHTGYFEDTFRKSIQHFEKALELEPDYPEAIAWLGMQNIGIGFFGYESMDKAYGRGKDLISKALDLDENIPEAHFGQALIAFYLEEDWEKVEKESRRALELNPNFIDARQHFAQYLTSTGRIDEAIREIDTCLTLDPVSFDIHNTAAAIYSFGGRFSEALEHHRKASVMNPDSVHTNLGVTYVEMGRIEDAVKEFEEAFALGHSTFHKANLGFAYAIAGRRKDALRMLEEIKSEPNIAVASLGLAGIYAGLGEKNEAVNWLERAHDNHTIAAFPLFTLDPSFKSLREEPRFKELVRKMGLDKYQTPKD
jgi:adenylate cyclase